MKTTIRFGGNFAQFIVLALIFSVPLVFSNQVIDGLYLPKQYWFVLFSAICFIGWSLLNTKRLNHFKVYLPDILIGILTIYQIFSAMVVFNQSWQSFDVIIIFSYVILYITLRLNSKQEGWMSAFTIIVIISAFINASCGLLQTFGFVKVLLPEFNIGAAIGNPGPYAIFLVLHLPFLIAIVLRNRHNTGIIYHTAYIALLLSLMVIIASRSRTAWIGSVVGIIFVVFRYFNLIALLRKKTKPVFLSVAILIVVGSLIAVGVQLYKFKKNSADGRILTWKVVTQMIADEPLIGHGQNSFVPTYNNYQAKYIAGSQASESEKMLADNATYAFNDILETGAETGIIGIILYLLLFVSLLVIKTEKTSENELLYFFALKAMMIGLVIMLMFSYPLQEIPIYLIFICGAALLTNQNIKNPVVTIGNTGFKIGLITLGLISLYTIKVSISNYTLYKEWKDVAVQVQKGQTSAAFKKYESLYKTLRYDPKFLYNYGAELSIAGDFEKSTDILKQAEPKLNDADFYIYLGNSYYGLKQFENAEQAFKKASNIVPHRLYPQYRLVFIYANTRRVDQALKLADYLVKREEKITTDISHQLKGELAQFIQQVQKGRSQE